jgi:chorismate dehydratase
MRREEKVSAKEYAMIKVGALNFSNAIPLFFAIQEKIIPNEVQLVWGAPVEINAMLGRGEVDIAMISSVDFLTNRFSYILLSDLGIAATERIISIRLFFKGNAPKLHKSTVYIPALSATSVYLLKSLCANFWKVSPVFKEFSCQPKELFSQDDPFLLIGDSCLRYHDWPTHNSIDIAQAWHDATKKSFIFAVVATRNDAFQREPNEIRDFHRLLEDSYLWARNNIDVIVKRAVQKTKRSEPFMYKYYSTIEYRLMSKHFHGLDYFFGLGV